MQSYGFPGAIMEDVASNGFGKPSAIPVTYVIDTKGILRDRFSPDQQILSEKLLDGAVQPLLNEAKKSH